MTMLWPRLPGVVAEKALRDYDGLSVPELSALARTAHPAQTFAAVGGARIDVPALESVRSLILRTAETHGFPDRRNALISFDRELAPKLVEAMPMAVAEASNPMVWNFVSTVLAPDVTAWRFGFDNPERWVCADRWRHMFSRLWWQALLLGADGQDQRRSTVFGALTETDLNQITERPRLAGYRPVAQEIAAALVAAVDEHSAKVRRPIIRDITARLRRKMATIEPLVLDPQDVRDMVGEAVASTLARRRLLPADESPEPDTSGEDLVATSGPAAEKPDLPTVVIRDRRARR